MSTALREEILSYDYGDEGMNALMRKVWAPFPHIINAYTDSSPTLRTLEMLDWLREQFGPEARPLQDVAGVWHRGGATVNGWTWIGFTTETAMNEFLERWRDEEWKANEPG